MKTTKDEHIETGGDPIGSLVGNISARPRPPTVVEQAVYQHVLEDWQRVRTHRQRRKKVVYWSVAASIMMAILVRPLLFQPQGASVDAIALGWVENRVGTVSVLQDNKRVLLASADQASSVFPGQSIITAAKSGASIDWGDGNTVRIDQDTELQLHSKSEIELVSGRIYVDIPPTLGQNPSSVALRVLTQFGSVNHIGTQFMVSSETGSVQVAVREGSVSIDNNQQVFVTQKGQQTTLGESDRVSHESILTYGADWQWAEQLAPAFELEGKTLDEFLSWVGRESGKQILFDTEAARNIARKTIMHGSIDDAPLTAMQLVLQTNELSWQEADGKIHLFVSQ